MFKRYLHHRRFTRIFFWALLPTILLSYVANGFSAEQSGDLQGATVSLAWDACSPSPDGYHLYQRAHGEAFDYSRPVWSGADTTCDVSGFSYDTDYYFVVRAFIGQEESADSNEVGFTTPSYSPAPANFTITSSAGPGGGISPLGVVDVVEGGRQDYAITAHNGFRISEVLVDGVSVGGVAGYTFSNVYADHTIAARFTAENQAPVADAGPDQVVVEGQTVTLNGNNSIDPDDGIAGFQWRQIQGPSVSLSGADTAEAEFTAPDVDAQEQVLVFELTVTDYSMAVAVDTCIVNVSWVNGAPTAQAGADQQVVSGELVVLDGGNSVDPDNGIASYQWRQLQGPSVTLSDPTAVRPEFKAPVVNDQGASLCFELTVTDNGNLQDTDSCIVTVGIGNQRPQADAGPDQQVAAEENVRLDGSNSMDADDGIAAYQWRQTEGTPVSLSDATAVQPEFTAPQVGPEGETLAFELAVTDRSGLQHDDACLVSVLWENSAPVAVAGEDQVVNEGTLVELDGTFSSDHDDGICAFQWTQMAGPPVRLSDPLSAQPTFEAPDVGPEGAALTFQLSVMDFGGLKSQDECLVNIAWINTPPWADAGADQNAPANSQVTLDGSGSRDDDDGIAAYRWKQTAGSPVTFQDSTSDVTAFTAPEVADDQILTFKLTVTDQGGLQSVDDCSVLVYAPEKPEKDTTPPRIVITEPDAYNGFVLVRRSKISLRGTASDDGQVARVVWQDDRGGSGEAIGTSNWRIDDLRLSRWFNTITITAYDAAGNQASATLVIFVGKWR